MTKTVCCAVAAAALVGTFGGATETPGPIEPVAVISLAGYNEVKADLGYVGAISGNPDLAVGLEAMLKLMTQNRGLEGLDKDRPWGVVVYLDHGKVAQGKRKPEQVLSACGFLPVTDGQALLEVLEPFVGEAQPVGDGVLKVRKKKTTYLKQVGDWLYFAPRAEFLSAAPEQPLDLIDGLYQQYDVAARLQLDHLPAELRDEALAQLKKQAAKDLRRKPGESDEEFAVREIVGRRLLDAVQSAARDVETVTLGWSLDSSQGQSHLDLTVTARPGTETAQNLAALEQQTSNFHGFLLPGATLSGNWSCATQPWEPSDLAAVFDLVRKQAEEDIDRKEETPEKREAARKLLGGLLDIVQETMAAGRVDGGMAVKLAPDAVTLAAGGFVADGSQVEATLSDLVEAVRAENPAYVDRVLTTDVAAHGDVRIHQVAMPIPQNADNREKLVAMFGETFDVLVGIGRESFFVSAGKDARSVLEEIVRASKEEGSQVVAPVEISLSVGALADFVAAVGKPRDRAQAEHLARLLEESAGSDQVKVVAVPVQRGVRFRLELDEGILKALGTAAQQRKSDRAAQRGTTSAGLQAARI